MPLVHLLLHAILVAVQATVVLVKHAFNFCLSITPVAGRWVYAMRAGCTPLVLHVDTTLLHLCTLVL